MRGLFELEYLYLPDFSLDRIVDAARPESMEARAFNILADEYTENPDNTKAKNHIISLFHSLEILNYILRNIFCL